jgi:hypothetical protein
LHVPGKLESSVAAGITGGRKTKNKDGAGIRQEEGSIWGKHRNPLKPPDRTDTLIEIDFTLSNLSGWRIKERMNLREYGV